MLTEWQGFTKVVHTRQIWRHKHVMVVVIDRYIGRPILSANFCVFCVYWHRPMRAAAFADLALFTDRRLPAAPCCYPVWQHFTERCSTSPFLIFVKYCFHDLVLPHIFSINVPFFKIKTRNIFYHHCVIFMT